VYLVFLKERCKDSTSNQKQFPVIAILNYTFSGVSSPKKSRIAEKGKKVKETILDISLSNSPILGNCPLLFYYKIAK